MDLSWTVITIATFLHVSAESDLTPVQTAGNVTSSTTQAPSANGTQTTPAAPTTSDSITVTPCSSVPPFLGLMTVSWQGCQGNVNLMTPYHSSESMPVCDNSDRVKSLLVDVCKGMRGCEGRVERIKGSKDWKPGYKITESGAVKSNSCAVLTVQCKEKDMRGPLQAYKVVTGLLCCVLLILLLIRFTKPAVKALQKRLSDRQKNRWIGPTQSHSVSYHRGKSAVKNNDGEKRMSYPALERLTVNDSREPSSSRNSYNF